MRKNFDEGRVAASYISFNSSRVFPMSTEPTPSPSSEPLRFDSAAPAAPTAVNCTQCRAPIENAYFEIDGLVVCPACRDRIESARQEGTSAGRFLRAAVFGVAAAVPGWFLYYAIARFANLELSLISILIGYMVGRAVFTGSRERGGWRYQALAMGITYCAIVSTYMPFIIAELGRSASSAPSFVAAFVIAAAYPILAGIGNIIGWFIIGVALYEAWRLNRKVTHAVTGPYRLGQPRDGVAASSA